jgi:hypothetical protein
MAGAFNLKPNPLVVKLGLELPGAAAPALMATAAPGTYMPGAAAGTETPGRLSFTGYVGGEFEHDGMNWCVLYLDWDGQTWLLIERDGILGRQTIPSDAGSGTPAPRDVLYVKPDAAVGNAGRTLTRRGLFLTGDFTRAGDYDAEMEGGTLAAATGVFCQARSPGCCNKTTRRP